MMMNKVFFGNNDNKRKWGAKVAVFALAGAMMGTLLTGCGSNGADSSSDSAAEDTSNSIAKVTGDLLVKQTMYDENGDTYMYIEYGYDENGFQEEENHYVKLDDSDEFTWFKHYIQERDEAGNLIKDTLASPQEEDKEYGYYEYTYDEHGNALTCQYWDPESKAYSDSYKYEYTYDDNGNMLTKAEFISIDGGNEYMPMGSDETYEYDENNNCIKVTSPGQIIEYTYEDGKCVKEVYSSEDGSISQIVEYEYDEKGNKIKANKFEADGTTSAGYDILEYAPLSK